MIGPGGIDNPRMAATTTGMYSGPHPTITALMATLWRYEVSTVGMDAFSAPTTLPPRRSRMQFP